MLLHKVRYLSTGIYCRFANGLVFFSIGTNSYNSCNGVFQRDSSFIPWQIVCVAFTACIDLFVRLRRVSLISDSIYAVDFKNQELYTVIYIYVSLSQELFVCWTWRRLIIYCYFGYASPRRSAVLAYGSARATSKVVRERPPIPRKSYADI